MSKTFKSSSIRDVAEHTVKKSTTFESNIKASKNYKENCKQFVKSSVDNDKPRYKALFSNGFIGGILDAYNNHYNLSLRPDNVWIAILTQFSLYMNNNSEAMREKIVSHSGKIDLKVTDVGPLYTANYSRILGNLQEECRKNIKNQEIIEWMTPNFTTSTEKDITASHIMLMSSLQSYFEFRIFLHCGIPNVTLEGTISDWEKLRKKVEQIDSIHSDITLLKWKDMLLEIIDQMILSVNGEPNLEFWDKICSKKDRGSGVSYLSGWLTAFTFFDKDGKANNSIASTVTWKGKKDGVVYPLIDTNTVVCGIVSVPVYIDDNGIPYDAVFFAGHFDYTINKEDAVVPEIEWVLALK